jgi:hypothetical protein
MTDSDAYVVEGTDIKRYREYQGRLRAEHERLSDLAGIDRFSVPRDDPGTAEFMRLFDEEDRKQRA